MPDQKVEEAEASVLHKLRQWGDSSVPPTLLATLVSAQHLRPFQPLPMLFPPVFLLSSYLNINGFATDAAGISASWSGLYLVLAMRRKQALRSKFGVRGITRGATLGLCVVQMVGGGLAYTFGKRELEEEKK